ncbi:hypothetical protein D4Q71_01095 [Rhodopseudomonas palustris]|nr:hypothetical protein B1S06_13305 [Rhodopseudomonas palustris]RJF69704.1 hypothetical protein D4Q71_01095 [Rhodopseudomonas palustris]
MLVLLLRSMMRKSGNEHKRTWHGADCATDMVEIADVAGIFRNMGFADLPSISQPIWLQPRGEAGSMQRE